MEYILIVLGLGLLFAGLYFIKSPKTHGKILIQETEEGKRLFSLEVDIDPDEIENMQVVVFKVVKELAE